MGALTGKTAVVTGASSGIGRAVALRLGEAGAHVFAAGRRAEALAGTVQAVTGAGGAATAVRAELRDPGAVQGLVDRAMTSTGRLDVMVNNAGVSFRGLLADGNPEAWREMLEVNVLALAVGSQAAVRAMRACGAEGHIVNISSSAARLEAPGFYGATKTAVNAITASLRQELERDTIRVVTVIPGRTATNLARHHPDLLRDLAASLGEDIGSPSRGVFPPQALDRAAAAAGPVMAPVPMTWPGRCCSRSPSPSS
jgi:NAD(P)-dependent dehydrogenase (short-subunit alcohol dehydrogenase family)